MAGLKFLSLAAAAVFFLANEAQADEPANTATRVDCSVEMNKTRAAATLADFKVDLGQLSLPITKEETPSTPTPNADYIKKVCDAMRKYEKGTTPSLQTFAPDGTYAYATQDGSSADCKAAVDYWKKAFSNFGGLPPAYNDKTDLYKDPRNVSLIALYNPGETPLLDCAYFACPAPTGSASTEKDLKALLCVTTPKALVADKAPFTEAQWAKVDSAVNSCSAAVPTFLAVTAAAVATLFL